MTYQLPDVEDKVLEAIHQKPTAEIQACPNYDIEFAGSLMFKRAQWLEGKLIQGPVQHSRLVLATQPALRPKP